MPLHPASLIAAAALCCGLLPPPAQAAEPPLRALRGVRIYPAPDAAPIDGGVVLVRGDRIVSVGRPDAQSERIAPLDRRCDGGVVMAGFQNSHVHLIGSGFADARTAPAATLAQALTTLLTRYGYTTAFDIASDRDNTLALRARVDSGEVAGPRILTTGLPLFPAEGLPSYMDHLSPQLLAQMPRPDTVAAALAAVRQNLQAGADASKLFLVTPQRNQPPRRMADDIAAAAAAETHRAGRLVFAHPTDLDGLRQALRAGVDILAHPPLGTPGPWPADLLDQLRTAGIHMIPTLKLLQHELAKDQVPPDVAERIVQDNVQQFGRFAAAGGKVLFGTDVDYMTDYDPSDEYTLMARAGMNTAQILASLTTTPAARWNETQRRGRVAAGLAADLVVLADDPGRAARHFAAVKCTIRAGQVLYAR